MPGFEYSRWDGSQSFSPQSADELFDKLSEYLYQYGGKLLDNLNDWEQEHPDVIDMLVKQGYVEKDSEGKYRITPRGIRRTETKALEQLFDVRGRGALGRHDTDFRGAGQVQHEDSRPYQYGDPVSSLNLHETLRNAIQRQSGGPPIRISEDDLVVHETEYQTACATVVLLDMSGSMTRYGKYGAAKKVAMGLQALVRDKYRGDSIEVIGFYSYASPVNERELLLSAPNRSVSSIPASGCESISTSRKASSRSTSPTFTQVCSSPAGHCSARRPRTGRSLSSPTANRPPIWKAGTCC